MSLRNSINDIQLEGDLISSEGSQSFTSEEQSPLIVFVGSRATFTDRLMQLVKAEFEGMSVLRVNGVHQLSKLPKDWHDMVRLIIVDEAIACNANANMRAAGETFSETAIGLSYCSTEKAKKILAGPAGPIVQMRCLPMQAPIDAWLAALHLLLLGQQFVPFELLTTAEERAPDPEPSAIDDTSGSRRSEPCAMVPQEKALIAKLTRREGQIMGFIAKGERNKEIARVLGLSEHTVKLHVHNILRKVGADNRTSAARWYLSKNAQQGN